MASNDRDGALRNGTFGQAHDLRMMHCITACHLEIPLDLSSRLVEHTLYASADE